MDEGMSLTYGFGLIAILLQLLYFVCLGIGIYCLILFIKLARRGIAALDIYINKHKNSIDRIDPNS